MAQIAVVLRLGRVDNTLLWEGETSNGEEGTVGGAYQTRENMFGMHVAMGNLGIGEVGTQNKMGDKVLQEGKPWESSVPLALGKTQNPTGTLLSSNGSSVVNQGCSMRRNSVRHPQS